MKQMKFPLSEKIRKAGGFDGKSLLIASPTATGKSKVGVDLLFHYFSSKPDGLAKQFKGSNAYGCIKLNSHSTSRAERRR